MLNIVIPMAGRGSRFADAGYKNPKPLIDVAGKPMIQVVIENLAPKCEHRFIFICQNEHIKAFSLNEKLHSYTKNCEIIGIDGITEGQVCTVLKAKELINNDEPVMTANSDQWIDFDINKYLGQIKEHNLDGMIMTMKADDPKWSFAKTDSNGFVTETAEKKVISNDVEYYSYVLNKNYIENHRPIENKNSFEFYDLLLDFLTNSGYTDSNTDKRNDKAKGSFGTVFSESSRLV